MNWTLQPAGRYGKQLPGAEINAGIASQLIALVQFNILIENSLKK
ncbi:hypothetical protein [Pseudalkalibacillus caeni]|nr:hypothetical protein [Pseudalkalibacillus caeni]